MTNVYAKKDNKDNSVIKKQDLVILMINIVEITEHVQLENVFAKTVSQEINVINKLMIQNVMEQTK